MDATTAFSRLSYDRQHALVLLAATLLRLGLFMSSTIPAVLERRPELSTPLTSFRSLKEGVFIYKHGTNPYDGGVFYHSPIYLALFTYIVPVSSYIFTTLLWMLADVLGSLALVIIWRTRIQRSGVTKENEDRDPLVAALQVSDKYLFNPYTLLSCLARTTTSLDNTFLLLAISSASTGSASAAFIFLAIVAHTSLYPVLLVPPILMLLASTSNSRSSVSDAFGHLTIFLGAFASLSLGNFVLVGMAWTSQTWGVTLTVSDLAPNIGMWWYFFTEMFDHFRNFFLGVFQFHTLIYVAPVCLRLRDDPLLATLVLMGVFGTWKSYPALGDTAVWAGLLGCFPEVVASLRHPLFTLTVHLYTAILLPLLHSLWLLTGTGNANFFYAATMVYGLNASLAVVDVLGAGLRSAVKRKVSEQILDDVSGPDGRWDREAMDKQWDAKGWAVVQFTSAGK